MSDEEEGKEKGKKEKRLPLSHEEEKKFRHDTGLAPEQILDIRDQVLEVYRDAGLNTSQTKASMWTLLSEIYEAEIKVVGKDAVRKLLDKNVASMYFTVFGDSSLMKKEGIASGEVYEYMKKRWYPDAD